MWIQRKQKHSFVQVVKSGCESPPLKASVLDENLISHSVKVESPSWLEKCYVGRLSKASNV